MSAQGLGWMPRLLADDPLVLATPAMWFAEPVTIPQD